MWFIPSLLFSSPLLFFLCALVPFFILFYLARITRLLFPDAHTYTTLFFFVMLCYVAFFPLPCYCWHYRPPSLVFPLSPLCSFYFFPPARKKKRARESKTGREKRRVPNCSPTILLFFCALCVIVPCIDPPNPILSFPFLSSSPPSSSLLFQLQETYQQEHQHMRVKKRWRGQIGRENDFLFFFCLCYVERSLSS